MNILLESALHYHNEGLNVIPVVYRDKMPALEWEQYHTRRSTPAELNEWFGGRTLFNLGIVHGAVSNGYIAIDIDHDAGIFDRMRTDYPDLFTGRVEQSGSLEGYHIPLMLNTLPDFGTDSKQGRPRGNKTWKTELGTVNIRSQYCQTLCPPSIHPSGNRYRFIKKGKLTHIDNLNGFMRWLDNLAPPKTKTAGMKRPHQTPTGDTLLAAVQSAYISVLDVFRAFGMVHDIKLEAGNELRLLGNGGLLVTEDQQRWYNFSDEIGGGLFEAWGWCRFGQYDKHKHFRLCLLEMAEHAGIDVSQYLTRKEEPKPIEQPQPVSLWTPKYVQMWERARI